MTTISDKNLSAAEWMEFYEVLFKQNKNVKATPKSIEDGKATFDSALKEAEAAAEIKGKGNVHKVG